MPTLYINEEMMEEVESVLNDGFHFITTLNTYDDNTTGLNACRQSSTIKIINIDRNVFGHILTGIKNGTFDGGYRRKITALIIYSTVTQFFICPYYALVENSFLKNDNVSGNKELSLFYDLFSNEYYFHKVIEAFKNKGINFNPVSYES